MDNVNHYSVKAQIKVRKIEREQINKKQIAVYYKLQEYIKGRKATHNEQERDYVTYFPIDERERAFMDALRVILQSGYFLAPHDFKDILMILREVSAPDPIVTSTHQQSVLHGTSFMIPDPAN